MRPFASRNTRSSVGGVHPSLLFAFLRTLSSLLLPPRHYPYLACLRDGARRQRVVDNPPRPRGVPRPVGRGLNLPAQEAPRPHIARPPLPPHPFGRRAVGSQQIARLPGGKRV